MAAQEELVETFGSYGIDWLYFLAPFPVAVGIAAYLFFTGSRGSLLARISSSLERTTGLAAWSAGGIGMGILALAVAVLGFYWDVAWHIELGRDDFIFTPAHMGILAGLALIVAAGLTTVVLATHQRAETLLRYRKLRIPWSAIPITLLGVGALCGFPLDEFWHRNYGIDVTMWGPTHMVMISGASLTPIALLLLYIEGGGGSALTRFGRWIPKVLVAALALGLLTWTGEFDFGVPQFQALYHPVLVMTGSAMALVTARQLLGPGGAIQAAIGALILRGLIALVLGVGLGLVIPRFPLYLGTAVAVEAGYLLARRLAFAKSVVVTGLLVATFGFASEWVWSALWGRHPWGMALLPAGLLLPSLGAIAATTLAVGMGRVYSRERARVTTPIALVCGAVIIFVLAAPLPRKGAQSDVIVETLRNGDRASVTVTLGKPQLAEGANWFEVLSWQGGAMERSLLQQVGPGTFRTKNPVPVTGEWKSIIRLANADTMIAAGVYLPADPEIGAAEVPVVPRRTVKMQKDGDLLLREAREGPSWPAAVAYFAILILAMIWTAALSFGFVRLQPNESVRQTHSP